MCQVVLSVKRLETTGINDITEECLQGLQNIAVKVDYSQREDKLINWLFNFATNSSFLSSCKLVRM